ncbi:uncharacterized protein LOC133530058 [Cydia pomonella]|uniref:uncharacterized protein LOC133530058 n=1 Tax=Cydia pomonella TaxID=82600 RepID=UPI002ADE8785|nr:uncharacterized protein LOC133530058 [Cydia pomonella]
MDDVAELLKTWELHDLVPIFTEQRMTIQALSALTREDLKDLIPQAGPRVLFTRCWRSWKNEFLPINDTSIPSFSGLDLSNLQFDCLKETDELSECVVEVIPLDNPETKENTASTTSHQQLGKETQTGILENLLKQSLETSSLLIYKGGSLDGDATRNLLASVIAKEILNENKNSPIVGQIYFKWTKLISELFPGERTTTYYIPACTTASGAVLQARGKLVHQVLNKRRRFQQLGSLTTKKRNREESPGPSSSSPRPMPRIKNKFIVIKTLVGKQLRFI